MKTQENVKQEVKGIFADAAQQTKAGCHGVQNEQAAAAAVVDGDGVKVSLSKSEKMMIGWAKAAGESLAVSLFTKDFEKTARMLKRDILAVFLSEKKALETLGGKNAEIFKATCKDVFTSGIYEKIDADTFKACRADAIDAYKERLEREKVAKQAAKVDAGISAAIEAAGLSKEQAEALMAAGLLKF